MKRTILLSIWLIGLSHICFAASGSGGAAAASAAGAAVRGSTSSIGVGNSSPSGFAPSIGGGNSVGSGSSSMGIGNATAVGGGYFPTGPGGNPGNGGASGYSASGSESYVGPVDVGTPETAASTNSVDVNIYGEPTTGTSYSYGNPNSGFSSGAGIDPDSAQ